MYIEPCCFHKQLSQIMEYCSSTRHPSYFYSNSDVCLHEILPVVAGSVPGCELFVAMPYLGLPLVDTIRQLMNSSVRYEDTERTLPAVSHLTLITMGENRESVLSELGDLPAERLTVVEDKFGFRCVACSNGSSHWVLSGDICQQGVTGTHLMCLSDEAEAYGDVTAVLRSKAHVKGIRDWQEKYRRLTEKQKG